MAADKAPLFAVSHCLPLGGNKKRKTQENTHTHTHTHTTDTQNTKPIISPPFDPANTSHSIPIPRDYHFGQYPHY